MVCGEGWISGKAKKQIVEPPPLMKCSRSQTDEVVQMNDRKMSMQSEAQLQDFNHDVFISYSRRNKEFARALEKALENYKCEGA